MPASTKPKQLRIMNLLPEDFEAAGFAHYLDPDGSPLPEVSMEDVEKVQRIAASRYRPRTDAYCDRIVEGVRERGMALNISHKGQLCLYTPTSHPMNPNEGNVWVHPLHVLRVGDGVEGSGMSGMSLVDVERQMLAGKGRRTRLGTERSENFDPFAPWRDVEVSDADLENGITCTKRQVLVYAKQFWFWELVEDYLSLVCGENLPLLANGEPMNGGRPFVREPDITEIQAWGKKKVEKLKADYRKGPGGLPGLRRGRKSSLFKDRLTR